MSVLQNILSLTQILDLLKTSYICMMDGWLGFKTYQPL